MADYAKYLVVGAGGFLGANLRFIVAQWAAQKFGTSFPMGTFLINVSGSFILGLFGTLAAALAWNDNWRLFIGIGFVGAFTTFSTFEYETFGLLGEGHYLRAGTNMLGSIVAGLLAVFSGVIIARLILRLV